MVSAIYLPNPSPVQYFVILCAKLAQQAIDAGPISSSHPNFRRFDPDTKDARYKTTMQQNFTESAFADPGAEVGKEIMSAEKKQEVQNSGKYLSSLNQRSCVVFTMFMGNDPVSKALKAAVEN